jgi:MFS family permease
MHDPYAALRLRDYRLLLLGGVLSSIGAEIQAAAVGWEVYERTESAASLGFTGLALFLPILLLALPAGQITDRYSRKLILQLAQAGMTLTSFGLAALAHFKGPTYLIFACLVVVGCCRAFIMTSRGALVALVVPPEVLPNAVTWNSSGWQIANVAGPALGGVMVAFSGTGGAFLASASCSLLCLILLIPIRPREAPLAKEPPTFDSLLAGVRFVRDTKLLFAAISLDLFAVLLGGATALLPIFARDILQVGPTGFGWLRAAPAIGALIMAVLLTHRPPLRRAGRALLLAVAGFGVATIVFGVSQNALLSFAMLALAGAFDNVSVVVRGTLVQLLTPDPMRGRVAAVNAVFISSSNELGAFESGITAEWMGPVGSVVFGGVGTIAVVLFALWRWPELAQLGSLRSIGEMVGSSAPAVEKSS